MTRTSKRCGPRRGLPGRLRRAVQQGDIHRPGRGLSIRLLVAFAESVRVDDPVVTGTAAMATRSRPWVTPCPHRTTLPQKSGSPTGGRWGFYALREELGALFIGRAWRACIPHPGFLWTSANAHPALNLSLPDWNGRRVVVLRGPPSRSAPQVAAALGERTTSASTPGPSTGHAPTMAAARRQWHGALCSRFCLPTRRARRRRARGWLHRAHGAMAFRPSRRRVGRRPGARRLQHGSTVAAPNRSEAGMTRRVA